MLAALRRKQSTVSTMAALALSGILPGIIIGPSDRKMLNGTFDKCFLQTTDSTDSSTKPNNANSNALLPIPGIPITMPIRPNVTLNIPEVNFDIIDESDDSEDDEHIQQPITGSRSNVSISESPYFTPRHSILSDLGNSILRIGTPPRMTLDCYSTDMRPLMLHQTSLCSDSDESSDGRWAIEPHSEINTTQTHPV
ncbi:hypothetical protein DPMN_016098 [Dreissena polymorpha]|uniref:Uncharacterized protein n=1 Tax=Dreissena polymorpha TaxID=45954 RepID=A0A9D4S676_DREPO|nr:hypothetical protein DPMN_016098 [Dreissena polymorpha]